MISDDNGNPRDYVCRHKSFAEVRLTEIFGVNNKATRGVVYLLRVFRVRFVCKVLFVLPVCDSLAKHQCRQNKIRRCLRVVCRHKGY